MNARLPKENAAMNTHRPFTRIVALTLSGILFWNPLISAAAELAVDKNGGGNTNIGQAGNGAPIVNIATPSGKGLSHNQFIHYNVGPNGLILNNSNGPANSSIAGGTIDGNPNLTNGTATVILNEVTSTNPSQLKGYTEVAGAQAHVIVANPNGITCDGCGFINTPRATLTTGKPVIEDGELKRYDVQQGQVTFEGQDTNVTNVDQFEIITRSAQLNAKLHGKHITAVLGANDVDAQTLAATPKEGTGNKPRLALDSSALGGMYANSIRLIGTESGVGVNLPGELAASAGDIRIDVNGKLMLASVAAAQELALKAQEIELKNAQAGKKASIEATKTLTTTGTLAAPQIEIVSIGFINTGSILAANRLGIQTSWFTNRGGSLVAQDILNLVSGTLNNQDGEILARSLALDLGETSWVNEGTLIAANDLTLTLLSLENRGVLGAGETLVLNIDELINQAGALIFSGADMAFYVRNLTNLGDIHSGGKLFIARNSTGEMSDSVRNRSGTIQSGRNLAIHAELLENVRDLFEVTETVQEKLSFIECDDCKFKCNYNGSSCSRRNDWYLYEKREATEVNASAPGWILSGADMTLVGKTVSNQSSVIGAQGNILIEAERFTNKGVKPGETLMQRVFFSRLQEGPYKKMVKAIAELNGLWAAGENADSQFSQYLGKYVREDTLLKGPIYTPAENGEQYQGVVQAGGSIQINAEQTIDNAIVRPHFSYVSAGETANGLSTPVSYNPQLAPDTAHKLIDPLAIAGLPTSGLFKNAAPDHPWLIEVAPYVNQKQGLGSDYLFALLGVPPDANQKRLGDALYEQWLIRQAILARLGQWLLDGFESEEAQYKALMDNAGTEAKALQLTLGVALSTEQIAGLKRDIVWLVEKEVEGQKVLAPVLYLAQSADRIAPNGALIAAGKDVLLNSNQLNNTGTIKAENLVALIDGKIENAGLMQSKEMLALLAQSIENGRGGVLTGQDIALQAQGDFINEASASVHDATQDARNKTYVQFIDAPARIEAGNALFIQAGGNLINRGGKIQAGGDGYLEAGQNLIIQSAQSIYMRDFQKGGITQEIAQFSSTEQDSQNSQKESKESRQTLQITQHGAEVSAGGELSLIAGQDLGVLASHVQAGADLELFANGQIGIESRTDEYHYAYHNRGKNKRDDIVDRVTQQSATLTGENVTLVSGSDLTLISSQIKADNDVALSSGGEINLLSASNERYDYHYKRDKDLLSSKTKIDTVYDSQVVSSQIQAAGDISLESVGDITLVSSRLQAGGDIDLLSEGKISLLAAYDEHFAQHIRKTSGFETHPGLTGEILHVKRTKAESNVDRQAAPNLIEAAGNITIQSTGDQRYQRAQLRAGEQLALRTGGDFWFDATIDRQEYSRSKTYGDQWLNRSKNKGEVEETLRQNELIAKGQPIIEAMGKIHVQILELPSERQELIAGVVGQLVKAKQPADAPVIDPKNLSPEEITKAIEALAGENPELAWLKQLNDRGDIDYERVKEVHKEWSRTFNGLTTLSAVAIVVVVTIFTAGTASSAVGAALQAAASTAFIQGTTTGRVDMNQVGKNAAVAFVTAGILNAPVFEGGQSLNQLGGFTSSPILQSTGGFTDSTQLASILGRGVINAGVSNLILNKRTGSDHE